MTPLIRAGAVGFTTLQIFKGMETNMNKRTLGAMPVNTFWALRERIDATLVSRPF